MTPQLQQALRLLQLSSLELDAEIQKVVETNPLLEIEESQETEQLEHTDLADELAVDSQWEDTFDVPPVRLQSQSSIATEIQDKSGGTLQKYLFWQMRLTPFTELEQAIAIVIIDSIEEDGYLKSSLADIEQSLGEKLPAELDEVEAVLHRIQHFDPIGIAARDLRECLLLQLKQFEFEQDDTNLEMLTILIDQHLDALAKRDYIQIKRALKINDDQLTELVKLIQLLNPRPASQIQIDKTEYIVPDVYVRKTQKQWQVSLNPDNATKLHVAEHYAQLIKRADNSADNIYLKNNLQEARWFLKSLQSRNETLIKVTAAIVTRQEGFLDHGDEAMRPLVLHDIAQEVGMHESTISRATNKKYLHTPRGIYELKYFFSSHVNTDRGGECSATAIRAIIKKLIATEDPKKPLSDNKITTVLQAQGIHIARRTITKYRETLAILPSNERKRLV